MVNADEFEAGQRAREYFHNVTVLPGAWTVLRLDGRGFSRFTERRFDKPFDPVFADHMVAVAQSLLTETGARYAYTESDEISLLFDPRFDLFGRGVEKLVSVSAGIASAVFTHAVGEPAHFDSRVWLGTTVAGGTPTRTPATIPPATRTSPPPDAASPPNAYCPSKTPTEHSSNNWPSPALRPGVSDGGRVRIATCPCGGERRGLCGTCAGSRGAGDALVAWACPFGSGVLGHCVSVQRGGPHPRDHLVWDEVQQ